MVRDGQGDGEMVGAPGAAIEQLQSELRPIRARRAEWDKRPEDVVELLRAGSARAEQTAAQTLGDVRRAMRIDYFENGNLLR